MKMWTKRALGGCALALVCGLGVSAVGSPAYAQGKEARAQLAEKPDPEKLLGETLKALQDARAKLGVGGKNGQVLQEAAVYLTAAQDAKKASDPRGMIALDVKAREVLNGVLGAQGTTKLSVSDVMKKHARAEAVDEFVPAARAALSKGDALKTEAGWSSWVERMKSP